MKLLLLVSFLSLWRRSDGTGSDVVKLFVTEGDDVIMPCSPQPKVNIEAKLFDWKKDKKEVFLFNIGNYYGVGLSGQDEDFKGRVSHFVDGLKHGNASILLRDTRTTDSGNYTCFFPHLGSGQAYRVELVVGAAPKPSVTILDGTKDWALLRCEVLGASPKPDVQWQNRAGDIVPAEEPQVSERGGSYDIILQTTVTKTDHYRCVSTQEEIHHRTEAETYVPGHDNLFKDKSCTSTNVPMVMIITIFSTLVIALLGGFLVKTIMYKRKKLLKCWSRGREAERDAEAETCVSDKLESQLPYTDAEPEEAEAGAGAVAVHQLNNGSGSKQTTHLEILQ